MSLDLMADPALKGEKAQVHWDLVGQPTLLGVTTYRGGRESRPQGEGTQVSTDRQER
jgi:hypothetical protein